MGKCRMKEYNTNEVIDKTGAPLICVGGYGQKPCKYYKECRAEMIVRLKDVNINVTEADRTSKWNLKKEEFNEGLEGFPEVHI